MKQIIVALDVSSQDEAQNIVNQLQGSVEFYKVGLQLLTAVGPNFVKKLVRDGNKILLDLKLHEIPNSVTAAVTEAGKLGVSMVTVHASAGREIMCAAVKAAKSFPNLQIAAITVVTSLNSSDLIEVGINSSCDEQVVRLAKLAIECGCHGIISSPGEIGLIRENVSNSIVLVTPGIRLNSEADDHQDRMATPAEAIKAGANYIIMGRSITQSVSPKGVVDSIFISPS